LNALPIPESTLFSVAPQRFSPTVRFGILTTQDSPPRGPAKFGEGLSRALTAHGADAAGTGATDAQPWSTSRVSADLVTASSVQAHRELLNQFDVAVIQHGDGGREDIVDIINGLYVPSIVVIHALAKDPTTQERSVIEKIAASAYHVVVMSGAAQQRLQLGYAVDRRKVTVIPHGASVPISPRVKRASRPIILTIGLLRPGKGVERVIDAMPSLDDVPGRPRYVVAGPTHPAVMAAEGEAYRDALIEQARRRGVADSVSFDAGYYDGAMLTAFIQQSAVVVLPYDSTEQVSSGVLVEAIASGRPVVATAFPHAVEMLNGGVGIVVDHDDPAALASALRRVVTQPRLAGDMAAAARALAPEVAWPAVADAYVGLAQRLIAQGRIRA
jgi:glycosyltransferase involved in cell wall biosynthesis